MENLLVPGTYIIHSAADNRLIMIPAGSSGSDVKPVITAEREFKVLPSLSQFVDLFMADFLLVGCNTRGHKSSRPPGLHLPRSS
jgi:hypothetical protein